MKILITGINGFLGRRLASALALKDHSVHGLGRQDECLAGGVDKYFTGSVLDADLVEKAVEGMDAVIHLAALTAHKDIVDNKFKALEMNFLGTKNVLDALRKNKGAKFIYSSTGKVYGDVKFLPITEEHPTLPLNVLGKSKLITEKLVDFYADESASFIVYRIFNVYGPGQKENFLVPTILKELERSSEITLGDTKAMRDYTYVDDVIDAFVRGIERDLEMGLSTFNICSGKGASAEDIVSLIAGIKGIDITVKTDPSRFRSDERSEEYGSYKKAEKLLGWQPGTDLKEGLEKTIHVEG